jgi:hypothetical protein
LRTVCGGVTGYAITRLLQFQKGKKTIVVEMTGFFTIKYHINFVMLQLNILQKFVENLLTWINIVEIRTKRILN